MRGFPKMLFYAHVYRKMAILAKESSDNFARIYIGIIIFASDAMMTGSQA